MKALVLDAEARTANLQDVLKPSPAEGQILVEVQAISLNPIDPLYVANPLGSTGRTVGSDFAGTVSALGCNVPSSSNLEVGDRVAGFLQGACSVNERPGAFAEYLVIDWDLVFKIPDSVSTEEASGVSLVALTAAQGLYYRLGLEAPFAWDKKNMLAEHPELEPHHTEYADKSKPINVFIYSASTAVGLYGAQLARLSAKASGWTIKLFGAASKARWDMLKAEPYSYDQLVDYRDSDWSEQIINLSKGARMDYVYDCISEDSTVEQAASTLASNGKMAIVRSRDAGAWTSGPLPVEPMYGAVWEGLGADVHYGLGSNRAPVLRSPAARAFAVEFYKWVSQALGSKLRHVPIRVMPGGLERVTADGLVLLGAGTMEDREHKRTEEYMKPVSAEKLVYRFV
ncbi:uncharacterized protein LTR77_005144 [Saxophila tyrrhenica]|uniref:Enoyl reductase (ER) domain-containing protein n=1 Tax=Saxophila tyrrhenica TaxID=1690608 RepID=A0AAV9PB66_9PEZI|nr:hypothetical protein LTR77_005144 [Saxophila tyrrhenica]